MNSNDIPKVQEKPKEPTITIIPYDSLQPITINENDTLQNKKFIGQKLFLPPSNRTIILSKSQFTRIHCIVTNYRQFEGGKDEVDVWTNVYKPESKCLKASGIGEAYTIQSSIPDSVRNRYYTIIDIIIYDSDSEKYKKFEKITNDMIEKLVISGNEPRFIDKKRSTIMLKLKDDINGDTLFYGLYRPDLLKFEFVSVGYYMKLKKLYEGKNMIWYLDKYNKDAANDTIYNGKKFMCTSIKLSHDEKFDYSIVANFKNDKVEFALKCPKDLSKLEYPFDFFNHNREFTDHITPKLHQCIDKLILEDDVNSIEKDKEYVKYNKQLATSEDYDPKSERLKECISLYGKKNGTLVANYTIALGMTKAMCESAGLILQLSTTTKKGKSIVMKSRSQTAVLLNGIVTKTYEY